MATGFANVGNFGGESLGNAMLKAETKQKTRNFVNLWLGFLR